MNSQSKILAVLFGVLVVLIFTTQFNEIFGNKNGKETGQLFEFALEDVESFRVNNFTLGLLFERRGDDWFVKRVGNDLTKDLEKKADAKIVEEDEEFKKAQSHKVAKALTYLVTLPKVKPISTKKSEHKTYEINPFSLHVILYDKNHQVLDRVDIGKTGPDPFTSFLSKHEQEDVYLVPQDFRALFLRPFASWVSEPNKAEK